MILFLWRLVCNLFLEVLVDLPVFLLGCIILAVVLPFIPKTAEKLPNCVAWFDNYSGHLRGYPGGDGLSGPPGYRVLRLLQGHTNLFWERFYWLALRNPANYFSYTIRGHLYTDKAVVVSSTGPQDPEISRGGFKHVEAVDHEDRSVLVPFGGIISSPESPVYLYEYYYTKFYTLLGRKFYIRFRMGYKIIGSADIRPGQIAEQVFTFNPFQPDRS